MGILVLRFREITGALCAFFGVFLAALFYLGFLESQAEGELGRSELEILNRFLSTFLLHERTAFDLAEGNFSAVTENIGTSIDPFTECILFYRDLKKDSDDSYGGCGPHRSIRIGRMGWDIRDEKIILAKPVGSQGAVVLFRNNPRGLTFDGISFDLPLSLRHLQKVVPQAFSVTALTCLFIFIFLRNRLNSRKREYLAKEKEFLKKEYEIKSRQLHDVTSLATGMAIWGHRLREESSDPFVGELLIAASDVSALCTAPEKPMKIPTNIRDFSRTLLHGYFFSTGEDPTESVETGPLLNQTILVSQTDLMRTLKNLLENADKCRTSGKIIFSVLKVPEGIRFVISNRGRITDPKKIFEAGFSGRGSSGNGLTIVSEALKNLNSSLKLTQENDYVTFSFDIADSNDTLPFLSSQSPGLSESSPGLAGGKKSGGDHLG